MEQKIKLIADTACDIPDELLKRHGIDMPSVPITIDGKSYFERKSFSIREFYDVLAATREIPATSRVPAADYLALYKAAYDQGYTDIISVTINAGGSGTNDSSRMAIDLFFEETPEAKGRLNIHLVDSKTYSMAYGYPVVEAAKMAEVGKGTAEILAYLHDFFDRMEIYLVCYSLEYARKSGRITAAAAIVGDALGLRPVIAMVDGTTKTVDKIRGDKTVPTRLLNIYRERRASPDDPVFVISAAVDEYGRELQALMEQELGRPVADYKAGASIVINAGPKIVAVCLLGEKRQKTAKNR